MTAPVTRLSIRVSPGAARSAIVGRYGRGWKVRVAATPVRGRANEALVDLLSETLAVPRSRVRLVSGSSSREKVVELAGIAPDEIDDRLLRAGGKES